MKLPHDAHKRNPRKQIVFHLRHVDQDQSFTEVENIDGFLWQSSYLSARYSLYKNVP